MDELDMEVIDILDGGTGAIENYNQTRTIENYQT